MGELKLPPVGQKRLFLQYNRIYEVTKYSDYSVYVKFLDTMNMAEWSITGEWLTVDIPLTPLLEALC
jgi:hypothetical protein